MTQSRMFSTCVILVALCATGAVAQESEPALTDAEKALTELCDQIKQSPDTASEQDVLRAADQAAELGRPFLGEQALRHYLAAHSNPTVAVREKSIDSARRVGDYQSALVRSKGYLDVAQPGEAASRIAGTLYWMQIDVLRLGDDAYRTMNSPVNKLCVGSDARKFDAWFLEESLRRGDYAATARRLAEIHQTKLPRELTQRKCDRYQQVLFSAVARPEEKYFAAAEALEQLSAAAQGDDRLKLRAALNAAHLRYAAAWEDLDPAKRDAAFAPVAAAANAYVGKFADADALYEVMLMFSHQGFGEDRQGKPKQAFFASAFGKLPNDQKSLMLKKSRVHGYASGEQWSELAVKNAQAFQGVSGFPFAYKTRQECQRLEPAARDANDTHAMLIRTLAASDDFAACVKRLLDQDAWRMNNFDDFGYFVSRNLRGTFENQQRAKKIELPPNYYAKVLAQFGADHIAKTPLALGPATVNEYLNQVWVADPDKMDAALESLAWVPFTPADRKRAFDGVYQQFLRWAKQTRKDRQTAQTNHSNEQKSAENAKKNLAKAKSNNKPGPIEKAETSLRDAEVKLAAATEKLQQVQQDVVRIGRLETVFKKAMQAKSGDANKAPNPLCRHLLEVVLAGQRKDSRAYADAARKLYPLVKDYRKQKVPFGRRMFQMLSRPPMGIDAIDVQAEFLADQLKNHDPDNAEQVQKATAFASNIVTSRPGWSYGRIPVANRVQSMKLHEVFADALAALM
ncbi:MAG: hypothetical protein N2C14_32760, partial [Planctomycetales bacterium]